MSCAGLFRSQSGVVQGAINVKVCDVTSHGVYSVCIDVVRVWYSLGRSLIIHHYVTLVCYSEQVLVGVPWPSNGADQVKGM